MTTPERPPVVHLPDLPLRRLEKGSRFASGLARVGPLVGAVQLGAQLHVVPSGKAAFPFHAHHTNEELYVVLEGTGTFRLGDQRFPVRAGDVVGAPAGEAATAHQMINTGETDLKYLVVSTRHDPDVVEYPDSGKFAVASRVPTDKGLASARAFHVWRSGASLDYWDGEDTGEEAAG